MTGLAVFAGIIAGMIVFAVLWVLRRPPSHESSSRLGWGFVRTVERTRSPALAGEDLRQRVHIHALPPSESEQAAARWRDVHGRFAEDPAASIAEADRLASEVMRARGYPMSDFERHAERLWVDHPNVVENYRVAHTIAAQHARGEARTEDLRKALVYYRVLFDELLGLHPAGHRRTG
jgi:hypothetical protein